MPSRNVRLPSPAMVVSLVALFASLGGTAYAATGGNFILGQANSATTTTALTSSVATGPALTVSDTGGKPAAKFVSNAGVAPFQVSSTTKVNKLNADKLDDLDSTAFARASVAKGQYQTLPTAAFGEPHSYGAGMLDVWYFCPVTISNNGTFYVQNQSGSNLTVFIDSGTDNPNVANMVPTEIVFYDALAAGDSFVIQAHGSAGDLVVHVATVHRETTCAMQTQGVFTS